jgi:hypothetical protein
VHFYGKMKGVAFSMGFPSRYNEKVFSVADYSPRGDEKINREIFLHRNQVGPA